MEFQIECSKGSSILEAAIVSKLEPPYSCLEGHCGTCSATILEGKVEEAGEMRVKGSIVKTCISIPASETVVISFEM